MNPATGVPWRALVVLAALVLLAHWLMLRAVPGATVSPPPASTRPLALRTVAAAPAVPAAPDRTAGPVAAPAAPPPGAAQPAPRSGPPARRVRPDDRTGDRPRPEPAVAAPRRAPAAADATSAAVALQPPGPARLPDPATWRYEVTGRHRGAPVAGQATVRWSHDGTTYRAHSELALSSLPVRQQHSTGHVTADGLAPLRFSDRSRSEEAAHFDRVRERIVFSANRPAAALQPGAQDRLSVLLQLAALVAGDPARFPAGAVVLVQTAGTRDADAWRFVVDGTDTIALPAGPVPALRITRAPRGEHDPRLELWLGPGPDYAPMRLRLTFPHGDWLDWLWSGTDKG